MNRLLVAVLVAFLGPYAAAQVDLSDITPGEQVAVELESGWVIVGKFVRADASKLTVALSGDDGQKGWLKIEVDQVVGVRAMREAPAPEAPKPLQIEKPEIPLPEAPPKTPAAAPEPTRPDNELTPKEESLLALLKEFPPSDNWNDKRYADIGEKDFIMDLRPTLQEERFVEVYPDWIAAKALQARLDRGETPGQWKETLAPQAAYSRFSPANGWSEEDYEPMRERLFFDDFELWLAGRGLVADNAAVADDPAKLTDDEKKALEVFLMFPEKNGWNDARYEMVSREYSEEDKLTEEERLFVLAFPDFLEGKSISARAQAARRAPNISYDEINREKKTRDVPGENISTTPLPDESISTDNIAPLDKGQRSR